MISKDDKHKILNGAFAVSRDGRKCKFVGKTAHVSLDDVSLNIFTYFNSDELVTGIHHVNDDLLFGITYESDYDVVGLWDDSIKPFNLEKALAGEPVITREGNKAYVKYVMPDEHRAYAGAYPLNGYILNHEEPDGVEIYQWTKDGSAQVSSPNHRDDIIGMWREPEPATDLNTVAATLPRALKEPQDGMWGVSASGVFEAYHDKDMDIDLFNQRVYFGAKEDAQAWFEAMLSSKD